MKDPLIKPKKSISIFHTAKDCPLSYVDLLTFCFRADQYRYETLPTSRRVAKSTGLKEATTAASSTRLQTLGLLGSDFEVISPCSKLNWFHKTEALAARFPNEPEFSWLSNWRTLVRRPGADNVLTVPAVMIYSLIRHSLFNKWKPTAGWTQQYMSQLTGCDVKTVALALAKLEEYGFLSPLEGMRFRLYQLTEAQLSCFADKGEWMGNSSEPDECVQATSPNATKMDLGHAALKELRDLVDRYPITEHERRKVINAITKHANWPTCDWRKAAGDAAMVFVNAP